MSARSNGAESWDELQQTRDRLVRVLRQLSDGTSWQGVFDNYWILVHSAASQCGLSGIETEEVVKDTLIEAAESLQTSRFNPAICSLKSWLMQLTRWQIIKRLRQREGPNAALPTMASEPRSSDTEFLSRRLGDNLSFESIWEEAWRKHLRYTAVERVRELVPRKQYQIYFLRAVQQKGTGEVARLTGVSSARVFLVHHRVAGLVKKELARLQSQ